MKKFKYKTSFSSTIKPYMEESQSKIAKASLESLKAIIPESVKDEADLLAIAFNSCVPNLGNKNGDMIDGKTALAIYKSFLNKPINVEHERTIPIGHIVSASFSEFDEDYKFGDGSKIIEASEIEDKKEPINLALSAVLYKLYSTKIVEAIEESSNPNSDTYLKYSASWELAFDDYVLAVGSKRLDECKIISDSSEIAEMEKYLLGEGGSGRTPEGDPIFRLIIGDVIPLGIGITENPAGDVAGITSSEEEETIEVRSSAEILERLGEIDNSMKAITQTLELFNKETLEKSSQNHKEVVKANNDNKKPEFKIMEKIKTTKDITDTLLKAEETHASDIRDFIDSEVNRISDEYEAKRTEVQDKLNAAEAETSELKTKFENAEAELKKVQEELKKLTEANEAREQQEQFTARMSHFDSEYELEEKTRNIVANKIKGLSEEDYSAAKEELEVLLAGFKVIKHNEESDECGCKSCVASREKAETEAKVKEAKASAETETESNETEVDEAVKNAEQTNSTVANTTTQEESLTDRAAKAFGRDAWEIKGKK